MDVRSVMKNFLASAQGPPWLPQAAAEARRFAYYGQLIFLVFALLGVLFGIAQMLFSWQWGLISITSAVLTLVWCYLMNEMIFPKIDAGSFNEASGRLLMFGILGIVFGIIPGFLILIGFVKMQGVFQPSYQPSEGQVHNEQVNRTNHYQPKPEYQTKPQEEKAQSYTLDEGKVKKKKSMVRCTGCGESYPSFMKECPNCGVPKK